MKKVILFIDSLGSGGAQRQVANVAVLLKKQGYDVQVLVYREELFFKPLLDENNVPIVLIQAKKPLERIYKIRRYLNRSGCRAVIAFLETPCFIACLSRIGHRKWRLITTERSAMRHTFTSRRNRFFNLFERFADAKIGNSQNAMELWKTYYPQYNDKYGVIYNYVSVPEAFSQCEHDYLSCGRLRVTVAASYQALKNPIAVVEALHSMTEEQRAGIVIDWYGSKKVAGGSTEIYDKVEALVKEYGLSDSMHLHEQTNEIYQKMAQSDAVGLFSTVEGLPNAICEAMTIGRPIIMSRVSDYDVLVGDNGVLCDPHSVESIRDALAELLSKSREELADMGVRSSQKAAALFSAETITRQWMDVIEGKEA